MRTNIVNIILQWEATFLLDSILENLIGTALETETKLFASDTSKRDTLPKVNWEHLKILKQSTKFNAYKFYFFPTKKNILMDHNFHISIRQWR